MSDSELALRDQAERSSNLYSGVIVQLVAAPSVIGEIAESEEDGHWVVWYDYPEVQVFCAEEALERYEFPVKVGDVVTHRNLGLGLVVDIEERFQTAKVEFPGFDGKPYLLFCRYNEFV